MKITFDKFPALRLLDEKQKIIIGLCEDDASDDKATKSLLTTVRSILPVYRERFLSSINIISSKFGDAAHKAKSSLMPLFVDFENTKDEEIIIQGTYIYKKLVTFCYINSFTGEKVVISFLRSGALAMFFQCDDSESYGRWWASKSYELADLENSVVIPILQSVAAFGMFKSYADVETEVVNLNKKIKPIGEDEPIYNKIPFPVTWLNCNWFTNIIRSEGFGVRGHFRFQRVGPGRRQIKMVEVKPYRKSGYHRRAQKVIEAEEAAG
jgi:hypothetical protein